MARRYFDWAQAQFELAQRSPSSKVRGDHLGLANHYLTLAEGELVSAQRTAAQERTPWQSDILEHAAICASQGACVTDPTHRMMLNKMRQLWNALAWNTVNLTNAQLIEEYADLADLHKNILATTRPTLQ